MVGHKEGIELVGQETRRAEEDIESPQAAIRSSEGSSPSNSREDWQDQQCAPPTQFHSETPAASFSQTFLTCVEYLTSHWRYSVILKAKPQQEMRVQVTGDKCTAHALVIFTCEAAADR